MKAKTLDEIAEKHYELTQSPQYGRFILGDGVMETQPKELWKHRTLGSLDQVRFLAAKKYK